MSGQWEVVGKKKEKSSKIPQKIAGQELKNKIQQQSININDVLPKSQLKNLYNGVEKLNKENKKPQDKKLNNDAKKPAKKPEKASENQTAKPKFKSIESALVAINVEEFKTLFEKSKILFPQAPLVWLKEMAQFLNLKVALEVSDPVFSSKSNGYPLKIVPSEIKAIMEKALAEAGSANIQLFFDISLTTLATDMSKGLSGLGHKFFLQLIASTEPALAISGMQKHIVLRNSYQNRPNIGLSILWALAQAGLQDIRLGLNVFQEFMLPIIEMKNYSRFIVKYLLDLIKNAKNTTITKEEYFVILDTIFSDRKNFPNDLKVDLLSASQEVKKLLFLKGRKDIHLLFDAILKKFNFISTGNKSYQKALCEVASECLGSDKMFLYWEKIYPSNVAGSAILLSYLESNWSTHHQKINKKQLSSTLEKFKSNNEELLNKKRRESYVQEAQTAIIKLSSKMGAKESSGFPMKTLMFLMVIFSSVFVALDVKSNGSWSESTTAKFMKTSGVCHYSHLAWNKTTEGVEWVDTKLTSAYPEHYKATKGYVSPYFLLLKDVGTIAYNIGENAYEGIAKGYPIVVESIETYAPGLQEKTSTVVKSTVSNSVYYFNASVEYLKNEVFVGQLSPENIKKVVLVAVDTTQQKASEAFHWVKEKVQTTIK